ncbi:helix-turn-helix transcriptional regulator [Paenibacillus oryzisoli]|uniref:helix-turn-helix domain-containing protein n=1 Tax=Paenibacillus oryzisoli TaxID=1850517 RepID=UPI003D2ADA9C
MIEELLYKEIGTRIKTFREKKKWTQEELADRVHRSRTSITNIEQGKQRFQIHSLYEIAETLGITPLELLPQPAELITNVELPEKVEKLDADGIEFFKKMYLNSKRLGDKS